MLLRSPIFVALAVAACGAPPSPASAEPPPRERLVPAARPASPAKIGGVSISQVEGGAVVAAAAELGWAERGTAVSGGTLGRYQSFRFELRRGDRRGFVEIVRPAKHPTGGSGTLVPPARQRRTREAEGAAVHYDEGADVLVVVYVEQEPALARALISKLVR